MKALKLSLIVLGAVSLGIGLFMVVDLAMHMPAIMRAANTGRSGDAVFASPMATIWILSGVGLLCGLLIGLGAGLPSQTASQVRKQTLEEAAAQRERSIRENALKQAGTPQSREDAGIVPTAPASVTRTLDVGEEKTVEIPASATDTKAIEVGRTTDTAVDASAHAGTDIGASTEENGR